MQRSILKDFFQVTRVSPPAPLSLGPIHLSLSLPHTQTHAYTHSLFFYLSADKCSRTTVFSYFGSILICVSYSVCFHLPLECLGHCPEWVILGQSWVQYTHTHTLSLSLSHSHTHTHLHTLCHSPTFTHAISSSLILPLTGTLPVVNVNASPNNLSARTMIRKPWKSCLVEQTPTSKSVEAQQSFRWDLRNILFYRQFLKLEVWISNLTQT